MRFSGQMRAAIHMDVRSVPDSLSSERQEVTDVRRAPIAGSCEASRATWCLLLLFSDSSSSAALLDSRACSGGIAGWT